MLYIILIIIWFMHINFTLIYLCWLLVTMYIIKALILYSLLYNISINYLINPFCMIRFISFGRKIGKYWLQWYTQCLIYTSQVDFKKISYKLKFIQNFLVYALVRTKKICLFVIKTPPHLFVSIFREICWRASN